MIARIGIALALTPFLVLASSIPAVLFIYGAVAAVGALLVGGRVLGALILPALSNRYQWRVPFIVLALAASTVGLVGITFVGQYGALLAGAAVMASSC